MGRLHWDSGNVRFISKLGHLDTRRSEGDKSRVLGANHEMFLQFRIVFGLLGNPEGPFFDPRLAFFGSDAFTSTDKTP